MKVLVTGAAGFIGFHLSKTLLEQGISVIGFDNLNPYYDVHLKHRRIERLKPYKGYINAPIDITDYKKITKIFYDTPIT